MNRLLSSVALCLALTGCAVGSTGPASSGEDSPAVGGGGSVERAFLARTAEHLCEVQGQVYPDQEALAAAYASTPDYPGIDEDEVARLSRRLATDPDFSRELHTAVADTCGAPK